MRSLPGSGGRRASRAPALPVLALLAAACAAGGVRPSDPPAMDGGAPAASAQTRELTADQQVAQALARLTFGARPGDAQRVRAMGVDRWIALQLEPRRIRDDSATRWIADHYETLDRSAAQLLADNPPPQAVRRRLLGPDSMLTADERMQLRMAQRGAQQVRTELGSAKVARAVLAERQLEEVMVDFWENHFSVFADKGPERYLIAEYDRDVIRPRALGKFRDLLGAVAKSPAMLFYLDNWESAADSGRPVLRPGPGARAPGPGPRGSRGLNENYARELLELHTLGVDGGYTQHDVIDVARALTGWSIEQPRRGGGFVFRPRMHDAGEKVVLGHRLRAGRGIEDGEEVLDIVARHPSTARFIARKLAVRFVSDSPPPALVERAAATFTRTGGDIRETVRTIVTSPEFFSRAAWRAKVKSPFELVTSALRAVNAAPDPTPRTAQIVARLGQPIFGHRDPNGWPETGEAWINTGSILNRINFGTALAAGRIPGATLDRWPEAAMLVSAPREAQVDGVIALLLAGDASPDTRAVLLAGENPLASRSAEAEAPPGDSLALLVGLALGSPEFQRR